MPGRGYWGGAEGLWALDLHTKKSVCLLLCLVFCIYEKNAHSNMGPLWKAAVLGLRYKSVTTLEFEQC